jgi:GT2 family glycosyltransferase
MTDLIEFLNVSGRIIMLSGASPEFKRVHFAKAERKILPRYFVKYVPRYLKIIKEGAIIHTPPDSNPQVDMTKIKAKELMRKIQQREERRAYLAEMRKRASVKITKHHGAIRRRPTVGATLMRSEEANKYLRELTQRINFSISNDIGIGILSFNRLDCIKRLVKSIRDYTDLTKTTIIISDESTESNVREYLGSIKDMAVLLNKERLGVAGNTNRLLRCLGRFQYKILLNDDVEILEKNWEQLYARAMHDTGIHHFCMRQSGVYGAKDSDGAIKDINGLKIRTIDEKPQGAVFAFDHTAFEKVGFFDEAFGIYGMEHVDWSHRIELSGIQQSGFHDVVGSDKFYRVHSDKSAVDSRSVLFAEARKKYEALRRDRSRIYVKPTDKSKVPGVSFIVPFREQNRVGSIRVIIQNLKAQKYPYIEIIIVEQDSDRRLKFKELATIKYVLARNEIHDQPFNKALAFNKGFVEVKTNKIILHDADILIQDDYTEVVSELLDTYEGLHIGRSVIYLDEKTTENVIKQNSLVSGLCTERSVRYFEGGSLACRHNIYINIGGFNESFMGYGNEDTEFFSRLSVGCKFHNHRFIDLLHMYHGRTIGWKQHHERNKQLESKLAKDSMQIRLAYSHKRFATKYGYTSK